MYNINIYSYVYFLGGFGCAGAPRMAIVVQLPEGEVRFVAVDPELLVRLSIAQLSQLSQLQLRRNATAAMTHSNT